MERKHERYIHIYDVRVYAEVFTSQNLSIVTERFYNFFNLRYDDA